ncbi:patatin-like phospholipase family protein [Desulfotalea psychrophila]|nr:patatin-like phospholipase family protein [Desulfotalea psychrophila]
MSGKTVSLVLGSGGARGLAHIGVIRWLTEHDYRIESITGCSAGAVVGGVYAIGKLDIFEAWVRQIKTVDIVTLLDVSWGRGGLVKGEKFINTLVNLVGDMHIEDLPIKYTALATDIGAGKEVWLQDGKLFNAIRASISIPLLFEPYCYRGMHLVDGGVLNPVPIAPTFADSTDLTIAVNLNSMSCGHETSLPKSVLKIPDAVPSPSTIREKINSFIQERQESFYKRGVETGVLERLSVNDVAFQAFDAMQSTIARQKLAAYPPDRVVNVSHNACKMLEFNRAAEMIELGYQRAEQCLGEGG